MTSQLPLLALVLVVALLRAGPVAAQTTPSKTAANKQSVTIKRAEWSPTFEALVGISQQQFRDARLDRLTQNEFDSLFTSIYGAEQKMVQNAHSTQPSITCSPGQTEFQKIRVFVEVNDKTPAQIASGIRERLRALPDVEIVYDAMDADFGVSVLGLKDETESGRPLGFSLSVVTYDPCKESMAGKDWEVHVVRNHFVNIAPNEAQTIDGVVSRIDTDDIEDARKLHDAVRKAKAAK